MSEIIPHNPDATVSRGVDTLMPSGAALADLLERLAFRLFYDESGGGNTKADWQDLHADDAEPYRVHAASALNFMRETIQLALDQANASLDISSADKPPLKVGDLTMLRVFEKAKLTNVSDMQAVFNAIEDYMRNSVPSAWLENCDKCGRKRQA